MARTKHKKVKSSRTKKPKPVPDKSYGTYFPWGGHLFGPPERCEKGFTASDGGKWCDLGCCRMCSDKCDIYFHYIGKDPEAKKEWLRKCGVKNQY